MELGQRALQTAAKFSAWVTPGGNAATVLKDLDQWWKSTGRKWLVGAAKCEEWMEVRLPGSDIYSACEPVPEEDVAPQEVEPDEVDDAPDPEQEALHALETIENRNKIQNVIQKLEADLEQVPAHFI